MEDESKNKEFNKTLRDLINILFSFAFGFGLTKLENVIIPEFEFISLYPLAIGYIIILLSWWGYNWSTIYSGAEKKYRNYIIDVLLLIAYWLIIVVYDNILIFSAVITSIYVLYFIWSIFRFMESADSNQKKHNVNSIIRNAIFAILSFIVTLHIYIIPINKGKMCAYYAILTIMLLLNITYRIIAHLNHKKKQKK